jgi:hypothetical protein
MLKALRERLKSERAKDGDPKKSEEVASPVASATSPRSVPGTSMRGGDISQPAQTSHALASVESRPHDKVTSSTAQSAFSVQELPATTISTVPPPPRIVPFPPTASRAQAATSATVVSMAPNRPEQLWDLAYDDLKADEPALVEAYEKILSRELSENVSKFAAPELQDNAIEQNDPVTRRSQMSQLVKNGLKKTEKMADAKQGIGEAMKGILSAKDIVSSVVLPSSQTALAWIGICLALQVSLLSRDTDDGC